MIKKISYIFILLSYIGYTQDTDTQFRFAPSIDYKISKNGKWVLIIDMLWKKTFLHFMRVFFSFQVNIK